MPFINIYTGLITAKEIAKAVTKPEISKLEFTSTGDAATYLKENMKEIDLIPYRI